MRTLVHLLALFILLAPRPGQAASSVLVLDFGLRDDTLLPDVPQEVARVAALAPWVRRHLRGLGDVAPEAEPDEELRRLAANGYLLAHPAQAVARARAAGVRWVAIGYSNKFSFLISWVRVHLVDCRDGKVVARAEADLRGAMDDERMTRRTAANLAQQIHDLIHTVEQSRQGAAP